MSNGQIEYVGRYDDLVNIDGTRIKLGEISNVVGSLSSAILQVQTLKINHIKLNKDHLVSFISLNEHVPLGDWLVEITENVRTILMRAFIHCKKSLPRAMVPSYVIPIQRVPLAVTNNVDRKKLEEIFNSLPESIITALSFNKLSENEQWSNIESQIRTVFSKISGIAEETITKTQTIFQMGLDSISCIEASSSLRSKGIFLSVGDIISNESIDRMSDLLLKNNDLVRPSLKFDYESLVSDIDWSAYGINFELVENVLPALPSQVFMINGWISSNFELFLPTFSYKLNCLLDINRLRSSWEILVKSWPILRTTFVPSSNPDIPLLQVILKDISNQNVFSSSDSLDNNKYNILDKVPIHLHVEAGSKIHLTIHHALYDGWSLPMILSTLSDIYNGANVRKYDASVVEPLVCQIYSKLTEQRKFWTKELENVGKLKAIVQKGSRYSSFQRNACHKSSRISEFCKVHGLTIGSFLFSVFASVCSRHVMPSENRLVFGIYSSGRTGELEGLAELPYPTINIHPLVVEIKPCIVEMANDIRQFMSELSIDQRSQTSLWLIERWTGVQVDCAVNFLEGISERKNNTGIFEYHNDPQIKVNKFFNPWLSNSIGQSLSSQKSNINLDVELAIVDGRLDIGVFFSEHVMTEAKGDEFIAEIAQLIDDIVG
ncbi:condensation domain-containing protein [Lipomyces japonicus]|uniref:condensation domain-containing protein n=1 Tax=Lipomyces japonicus TaxID=56871 RepID=UPI0034CE8595